MRSRSSSAQCVGRSLPSHRSFTAAFSTALATVAAVAAVAVLPAASLSAQRTPARTDAAAVAEQQPDTRSVEAAIRTRIAAVPGAEVGVAVRDLAGARALDIGSDVVFHAASTMKVPVLIDLMREVDAGRLQLDQRVLLVNTFHSIVDGSAYQLDAAVDSDSLVFSRVGEFVTLRWLADRMITRSSNLATNALIALLDPARITRTMETFGARGTVVLRGVEDGPAYAAGRNNVTTAADLAAILSALERGRTASDSSTAFMRSLLLQQAFNDQIPAGLPPGTRVGHKTGQITATLHDAAIVYPPGRAPFVLVVLTRGIPDAATAEQLTADIAGLVWRWLVP